MSKSYTIVIKLGSSSLVDATTKEPKLAIMSLLVETVVNLRSMGHKVIIVSSGGIAIGLKALNFDKRPKQLAEVQAVAAVGQGRLIGRWDMLFNQFGQRIAQILLTRNDIVDWSQYKNAQNTIEKLLAMNVVPIVNENDNLSVSEIKFGDNDTLSAITAALVGADYLFLLTDVDCLYTDNPNTNQDAQPILTIPNISKGLRNVNTSSGSGSDVGTGGMQTKLIAADLATNAGVHTVIMKSETPANIPLIVQYMESLDLQKLHEINDVLQWQKLERANLIDSDIPLHTKFIANCSMSNKDEIHVKASLTNREFWILHGLVTHGAVVIDDQTYKKLIKAGNDAKFGIPPTSIIGVEGSFHDLECVELKVASKLPNGEIDPSSKVETVGRARCNYTSSELCKIKGLQSEEIEKELGYAGSDYVAHRENMAFQLNHKFMV